MKKVSVGSWAYCFGPYLGHPIPLDTVLEGLARMRCDGISLGGFKPHAHPDLYPTKADRKRLVRHIHDCGLEVAEYGTNLWTIDSLAYPEAYLALYRRFLDFAVDCGFTMTRVDSGHPPVLPQGMEYDKARDIVVETFRRMAEMAKPYGITVLWEFEPGFFLNKPGEIVAMHDMVGCGNFMYLLDTCHANMCAHVGARQLGERETFPGGAAELISRLKGKIGLVHLIDSDDTLHDNDTSTHSPFGEGKIDFDTIIPAILDAGYAGEWWAIDLCFWPDAWEVTRRCKEFVDGLNHKYCS
jgi:sugar phosphate isomerase/epimerase